MEVTPNPPPLTFWQELKEETKTVKKFLRSLDIKNIGNDLLYFNQQAGVMQPRGVYGWMPSSWTGANFDSTQKAFISLAKTISSIEDKMKTFSPKQKEEVSLEAYAFTFTLFDLQAIIESTAKPGLNQVCTTYLNQNANEKQICLRKFGEETFEKIDRLTQTLYEALSPHLSVLGDIKKLQEYQITAKKCIMTSFIYCGYLEKVKHLPETGVIIPNTIIKKCIKANHYSLDSVKNGANFISLPLKAEELPLPFDTLWIPLRPITEHGKVIFKTGITGNCEQDKTNLRNVYYRQNHDTKDMILSTSAIQTEQQAQQLIAIMQNINTSKKERWILHQLNSFSTDEKDVVKHTHIQIAYIQDHLQNESNGQSILHLNTAFNASTQLKSEDAQSLLEINIDSLASLVNDAIQDILASFVDEQDETSEHWTQLQTKGKEILEWVEEIKNLKKEINQRVTPQGVKTSTDLPHNAPISSSQQMSSDTQQLNSHQKAYSTLELTDEIKNLKKEIDQKSDNEKDPPDLEKEYISTHQLKTTLLEKQKQLKKGLIEIRTYMNNSIQAWKAEGENKTEYDKPCLILDILQTIFALQLKLKEAPSLSRCGEIELFLLLYRLLNMQVIISCQSGLDRTGFVISMKDALDQLERKLSEEYAQHFNQDTNQTHLETFKKMFQLILDLNKNRIELFTLGNQALLQNSYEVIKNLDSTPSQKINAKKFRTDLLQLVSHYPSSQEPNSNLELKFNDSTINNLEYTLYYLEWIVQHLLRTHQQKTFYSTGVPGLKYHYGEFWFKRKVMANPHPLERLPQFIFTEKGETIQLMEYFPSGWVLSESFKITPIATALICYLSHLRSTK